MILLFISKLIILHRCHPVLSNTHAWKQIISSSNKRKLKSSVKAAATVTAAAAITGLKMGQVRCQTSLHITKACNAISSDGQLFVPPIERENPCVLVQPSYWGRHSARAQPGCPILQNTMRFPTDIHESLYLIGECLTTSIKFTLWHKKGLQREG